MGHTWPGKWMENRSEEAVVHSEKTSPFGAPKSWSDHPKKKTTHGGFPRWGVPQKWMVYIGNSYSNLVGGFNLPLWNMMEWVRQLGWWNSPDDGKVIEFHGSSHHQPDDDWGYPYLGKLRWIPEDLLSNWPSMVASLTCGCSMWDVVRVLPVICDFDTSVIHSAIFPLGWGGGGGHWLRTFNVC